MPRRAKGSRAIGASLVPTPIPSNRTTPLSSAYPSTYSSENEADVNTIPISSLSLHSLQTKPTRPAKPKPFAFLSLPSELRLKIYGFYFTNGGGAVDLDPDNHKRIHKKLGILRACRTVYTEASHYFYSTRTFRIFPTHPGRFFKTKKPLLARLTQPQRATISSLELRLGPGWSKPPRGWIVNAALGLRDCISVRKLTIFTECDPSDGVFNGFRRADGFYEEFCRVLLSEVLAELPLLDAIYFDAWPSVKKTGAMMRTLLDVAATNKRRIRWGPERGWTDAVDEDTIPGESILAPTLGSEAFGAQGILVLA